MPLPNTARSLQTVHANADKLTSKENEKPAFKWLSGSESQYKDSMSFEPQT